jgi:DNA invertase Pin-like site-specific DNA recombinase
MRTGQRKSAERRRMVGVVRISVDRDDETSTATQTNTIKAWCELQDADLVKLIYDRGRSAYKEEERYNREGPREALRLLSAGAANGMIGTKIDRVARNARDLLNLVHAIEERGGTFVSVDEGIDTGKPGISSVLIPILGAVAQLESDRKSERIGQWQDFRLAQRMTPTGPRPFGYSRHALDCADAERCDCLRNQLNVIDDEAALIREWAQSLIAGESVRHLTARMVAAGVKTAQGSLMARSVKRILTSPTTAALRDVDGVFIDCSDVWEPILDRATWDELRSILLDPQRKGRPIGGGRKHLLSSLLECGKGDCDGRFHIKLTKTGDRYVCAKCSQSVPARDVEDIIESNVKGALDPVAWAALRRRGAVTHVDTRELERQLADALARFESDELTYDEWLGVSRKIKRDLAAVAEQPLELPNVKDPAREWDRLDVDAKRLLISAVMPRIVITAATPGLRWFDADRITWPELTQELLAA